MEPQNEHLANLKHPQSSMEHLNRREQENKICYDSLFQDTFTRTPRTRARRCLVPRERIIALTIHFPKTCLHGIRNPSRMRSLHLHKPSALFPQRFMPCRSHAFVLRSDAASTVVHRARAPTLLLPRLCHDGPAPDGVGRGHRWPRH